jgi:hypothetical protein
LSRTDSVEIRAAKADEVHAFAQVDGVVILFGAAESDVRELPANTPRTRFLWFAARPRDTISAAILPNSQSTRFFRNPNLPLSPSNK